MKKQQLQELAAVGVRARVVRLLNQLHTTFDAAKQLSVNIDGVVNQSSLGRYYAVSITPLRKPKKGNGETGGKPVVNGRANAAMRAMHAAKMRKQWQIARRKGWTSLRPPTTTGAPTTSK